jgi:hypothetical protein
VIYAPIERVSESLRCGKAVGVEPIASNVLGFAVDQDGLSNIFAALLASLLFGNVLIPRVPVIFAEDRVGCVALWRCMPSALSAYDCD